jgi:hypothetical protein
MVASIEYIEKIIDAFGQAAEASWNTPGRSGNIIQVTPELADEVMVTGDLHGHRRNFNLIKKHAALDKYPRRHLVLQEVCHGGPTYPQNGGCMSHTLLEDVARLKVKYPDRVHFILGNHELAELAEYPIQKNKKMLNLLFRLGLQQMYGPATDKVREGFFPFLKSCPLAVQLSTGVFLSHSVPEHVDTEGFDYSVFSRPLDDSDYRQRAGVFQLVWGRDYRHENVSAFAAGVGAAMIITGHEPCAKGFNTPNPIQVIIDCCAPQSSYVVLPTDRALSHEEIVQRIEKLG